MLKNIWLIKNPIRFKPKKQICKRFFLKNFFPHLLENKINVEIFKYLKVNERSKTR